MALTIAIHPGARIKDGDVLTAAILMRLFDEGYATVISGTADEDFYGDGTIGAGKFKTALNLSTNTITYPVKEDTLANILGGSVTPDSKMQIAIATDVSPKAVFIADGTTTSSWQFVGNYNFDITTYRPAYKGQVAIDASDNLKIATAASVIGDWKDPRLNAALYDILSADPTGVSGFLSLYAKDNEIYFQRGTDDPVQLTGVTNTGITAYGSPDWDSGWTEVAVATEYDLTATSANNFSSTSKSTTNGATQASGALSLPSEFDANGSGHRLIHCLFKPYSTSDYLTFIGPAFNGNTTGGTYGWNIWSDVSAEKLYLTTAGTGVCYNQVGTTLDADWSTGTGAITHATGLLRIKLWI